jgi:hypothetical protein
MKRIITAGALTLALAVPGLGLAAKTPPVNKKAAATKACKAERAKLGTAAFELKYGTGKKHENALGNCVSQHLKK